MFAKIGAWIGVLVSMLTLITNITLLVAESLPVILLTIVLVSFWYTAIYSFSGLIVDLIIEFIKK